MVVSIALVIVVIGLLIKIGADRRRLDFINQKLKLAIKGTSHSMIKPYGSDKKQQELVDNLNQLLSVSREAERRARQIDLLHKQMIASISHDFRTPLTSMLGYVQMLDTDISDEKRQRYMSIIEKRILNLSALIEDFYILSIIDSNEYPLREELIRPAQILQEHLAMYYGELHEKFDSCRFEIIDEGHVMDGDKSALSRSIDNVIKNAIVHGKGEFVVNAGKTENGYEITFSNDAAPMNDEQRQSLLQRTYTTSSKGKTLTSGLGLSIASDLLRIMNGTLTVSGKNSEISFTIHLN